MAHVRACGRSGKVEYSIDRDSEAGEVLLDAAQPRLESPTVVPDLAEGTLEDLHPVPPLVTLLNAEQDGVDVHHRGPNGGGRESTFRRT
jgi:hypothetical protein